MCELKAGRGSLIEWVKSCLHSLLPQLNLHSWFIICPDSEREKHSASAMQQKGCIFLFCLSLYSSPSEKDHFLIPCPWFWFRNNTLKVYFAKKLLQSRMWNVCPACDGRRILMPVQLVNSWLSFKWQLAGLVSGIQFLQGNHVRRLQSGPARLRLVTVA